MTLGLVRVAALAACALGVGFAAIGPVADIVLREELKNAEACPPLPARMSPSEIHLEPGITQHKSWIMFEVPSRFAGWFAVCLDDQVISSGGGVLDFHTGAAKFNVATRAVDLYWLARRLDRLADGSRWELRLQCAPDYACD